MTRYIVFESPFLLNPYQRQSVFDPIGTRKLPKFPEGARWEMLRLCNLSQQDVKHVMARAVHDLLARMNQAEWTVVALGRRPGQLVDMEGFAEIGDGNPASQKDESVAGTDVVAEGV